MRLPIALLVATASAVAMAQNRQPGQSTADSQQPPTFRAEANYVRVDMYAMQDGRAVEDLKVDEIEVLEDGATQKIETFEHVRVRPAGPQETRIEPNTVRESRAMAADPRARVFVIFLDTYHTQVEGSHNMRLPVVRFLDRVIGQDDLVAVMTPEMSPAQLTLGRKTTVISQMMQEDWAWGRRGQLERDPKEERYEQCYPSKRDEADAIAREMIDRRREKLSLDALDDLIVHLRGLREERKAVLLISEGWVVYRDNPRLARTVQGRTPGRPDVFVGRGGRPSTADPQAVGGATMYECDADRVMLSQMDHRFRVQRLADEANRANVSFYPIPGRRSPESRHASRQPASAVGEYRRSQRHQYQRHRKGHGPYRRGSDVVLPARVLLHEHQARREVPIDPCSRDAAGCGCSGETRLPRPHRGGPDD
jgi:VWFA-related protein